MSEHVTIGSDGAVRVITLARAEKKNAFTFAMYEALTTALAAADADPTVHVVLLEGAPGVFTAGNDLGDFAQLARAGAPASDTPVAVRFLLQLVALSKPLVCAVDGPAIGIGTTLLLHADWVLASTRARFALPFVNLGLSPEGGSTLLLPLVAGLQRASAWLLGGEPFDAEAARAGGLVHDVVAPEALPDAARSRARTLASRPLPSLVATKQLLRAPLRAAVEETIRREWHAFAARLASPEAQAAFASFLGKPR